MKCISDDEEGDIEAEIQRELDALQDVSLLHVEDVEDDYLQTTTIEVTWQLNNTNTLIWLTNIINRFFLFGSFQYLFFNKNIFFLRLWIKNLHAYA